MNFWDSSALLPLFIREATSETMLDLQAVSREMVAWTLTAVEMASAINRLLRMDRISPEGAQTALSHWENFLPELYLIRNVDLVKLKAIRLLRLHPLKAADALQLAAALIACNDTPSGHLFITLDSQLAQAASREGFCVKPATERLTP